jgi:hypothetical protein
MRGFQNGGSDGNDGKRKRVGRGRRGIIDMRDMAGVRVGIMRRAVMIDVGGVVKKGGHARTMSDVLVELTCKVGVMTSTTIINMRKISMMTGIGTEVGVGVGIDLVRNGVVGVGSGTGVGTVTDIDAVRVMTGTVTMDETIVRKTGGVSTTSMKMIIMINIEMTMRWNRVLNQSLDRTDMIGRLHMNNRKRGRKALMS